MSRFPRIYPIHKSIILNQGSAKPFSYPGKSEAWLMVNIQDNCKLYFKGRNDKPTAFTDVSIFGSAAKSDCENLTAAVCDILSEDAGVPSDRSYVKFEFSDKWGYDGYMF